MTLELTSIQYNFLQPNQLIKNKDSTFAYLNSILLDARKADLIMLKNHFSKYEYLYEKNIISKDFAIDQAVFAAIKQIKIANNFAHLIESQKYKHQSVNLRIYLVQELNYLIKQVIDSNRSNKNFDVSPAEKSLAYLNGNTHKTEKYTLNALEDLCNNTLQLGNSYSLNRQILDLRTSSAISQAKRQNKPLDFYLEKVSSQVQENYFPIPSLLSNIECQQLIKQEKSSYAKNLLKKTSTKNSTDPAFLSKILNELSAKLKQNESDNEEISSADETFSTSAFSKPAALKKET